MTSEHEMVTIDIDPESQLGKAIEAAGKRPIALVIDEHRYLVGQESPNLDSTNTADTFDRSAFRAALEAAAGTFTPEEGERLKQDIYRWREEGSRPIDKR